MLDYGFELEGFTVVRGPDVIWGGDIRTFHPPPGRFDGIIGGDPCQSHSSLANLVRAKGLEPSFPDMTPEYQRVVEEARPAWFLRENVPQAPDLKPAGYDVSSFMLDLSTLDAGDDTGHEQMRRRKWWFGVRDGECPELRQWIDFALFELPEDDYAVRGGTGGIHRSKCHAVSDGGMGQRRVQAVTAGSRAVPVAIGGSGKVKVTAVTADSGTLDHAGQEANKCKVKVTAVGGHDGTADSIHGYRKARKRQGPVTDRHEGRVGGPGVDYSPPRRDLAEMMRLQGLAPDWLGELDAKGKPKHSPFTVTALRKFVGNGVPIPMARALARAVRRAHIT